MRLPDPAPFLHDLWQLDRLIDANRAHAAEFGFEHPSKGNVTRVILMHVDDLELHDTVCGRDARQHWSCIIEVASGRDRRFALHR